MNCYSIYVTRSYSPCSEVWQEIKNEALQYLYMRLYETNAGSFTPFVKDGRTDELYYYKPTYNIGGKNYIF